MAAGPGRRTGGTEPKSLDIPAKRDPADCRTDPHASAPSGTAWVPWALTARGARGICSRGQRRLPFGATERVGWPMIARCGLVLVVVQNRDISCFRSRRDQQIGVLYRALRRATLGAQQLVELQRAVPLLLVDRAAGQRGELVADLRELGRTARAMEELETNDVACRELTLDKRPVERVTRIRRQPFGEAAGVVVATEPARVAARERSDVVCDRCGWASSIRRRSMRPITRMAGHARRTIRR
jgi:hypothetical protein